MEAIAGDILEDANQRFQNTKHMMYELQQSANNLRNFSNWHTEAVRFCRSLQDAAYVIKGNLDAYTYMHNSVDQYVDLPNDRERCHIEINRFVEALRKHLSQINAWKAQYQCNL